MSKSPNPFSQPDNWQEIFEQDEQYTKLQSSLFAKSFNLHQIPKPQLNTKPTFNLSNFMSFNFTHFTKYSIAGLATFTLLAGGLSAQALAPETLKPTQIAQTIKDKYFSANKQSDGNPQVPLIADAENEILELPECGLRLKYPKTVNSNKFKIVNKLKFQNSYSYKVGVEIINSTMFQPPNPSNITFDIDCKDIDANFNYYVGNLDYNNLNVIGETLSAYELRNETGWFISGDSISDIQKMQYSEDFIIQPKGYLFKLEGRQYRVYTTSVNAETKLPFSGFQIQSIRK